MEALATYWARLRPRFLYLSLQSGTFRLAWACPLWAVEEALVLLLALAPLVPIRALKLSGNSGWDRLLSTLYALLSGERLLRLQPGEIFVAVETPNVHIKIGQI